MLCPYCAEEIKEKAKKCKHCGEWLDGRKNKIATLPSDNSQLRQYSTYILTEKPGKYIDVGKLVSVFALSQNEAIEKILFMNPGFVLDQDAQISVVSNSGTFSCPSCHGHFVASERAIGCAVMIIIFISFGLGLIMIPFLPQNCHCRICGHKWKA